MAEWKSLKIRDNCKSVLWKALGLPLLPLSHFEDGIHIIQTEADKIALQEPLVNSYITYLRTNWTQLTESVTSFHCNQKMDPFEATFFNYLLSSISQVSDPDILKLISELVSLSIETYKFISLCSEG